ncbi:MAG: hypothetical protein V1816_25210 [Pseudomonadota bacterium]
MEFGQKLGTAILMIIPSLIGSVFLVDVLHSWLLGLIWLALMPVLYWAIITGKISAFFSGKK